MAVRTYPRYLCMDKYFQGGNAYVQVCNQTNERSAAMQKLKTVDADHLLCQPLEKPSFVVDGLIPTGLSLFCGSQKIGKSWLMLKLCLCVSQGSPFWEMPTSQSDVLYLCLEDTFYRIQNRLFKLTDEASERLLLRCVELQINGRSCGAA